MAKKTPQEQERAREKRVRAKVKGSSERPRLSVFRSNRHLYAQLIDDAQGKVLAAASDKNVKGKKPQAELARLVGKELARTAKEQGIAKAVFDRGGYRYHGKVKALAEGAREAGLQF